MEPRLQRRVQRYGWDLAVEAYDRHWRTQLAGLHAELMDCAAPRPGERVLDVACGTGLVTFAAAAAVGGNGRVMGIDLSGQMVEGAQQRAQRMGATNVAFARMDAEELAFADASFDLVLCALGLMYLPDPARAMQEMRRVLRPDGRIVVAVWGERARCGWAPLFGIVEAEVASDVCPLFFGLGQGQSLARLCMGAGLQVRAQRRLADLLAYRHADDACDAALAGGPVAMAWSRFDAVVRARVRERYVQAIEPCRADGGYRIPAEFVIVSATPAGASAFPG